MFRIYALALLEMWNSSRNTNEQIQAEGVYKKKRGFLNVPF